MKIAQLLSSFLLLFLSVLLMMSIVIASVADTQIYNFSNKISPFRTDFCSAYPEKNLKQNLDWTECCVQHDFSYWKGGSESDKILADNELFECVSNISKVNAYIMLLGVNIGGGKKLALPWHWGYGWVVPRSSCELKPWEIEKIHISSPNLQNGFSEYYQETNFKINRPYITTLNDYCLDIGLESIQSELQEVLRFKLINKEVLKVVSNDRIKIEVTYLIELINNNTKYNLVFDLLDENSCYKGQTDLQLSMSVQLKEINKID